MNFLSRQQGEVARMTWGDFGFNGHIFFAFYSKKINFMDHEQNLENYFIINRIC